MNKLKGELIKAQSATLPSYFSSRLEISQGKRLLRKERLTPSCPTRAFSQPNFVRVTRRRPRHANGLECQHQMASPASVGRGLSGLSATGVALAGPSIEAQASPHPQALSQNGRPSCLVLRPPRAHLGCILPWRIILPFSKTQNHFQQIFAIQNVILNNKTANSEYTA